MFDDKRYFLIKNYLKKLKLNDEIIKYYYGKSILVTGGAGAIGSNLVAALSLLVGKTGKIIVLDNLSSYKIKVNWNVPSLPNVLFVEGDVRDENILRRVFKEEIDIVFHLAAYFANQKSVDYPLVSADVDISGLIKLLDYSKIAKIEKFIYASSGCAIYGSYPRLPLKEEFISMHLTTPYQINKMAGELYCNYYFHQYEIKIVKCRFFNSYGPGEVPGQYRNVIPNFIFWAMNNQPIPITGTGNETRDFTFVLDLVQGLIKGGYYEKAVGQEFNIASGKEIKIIELANMIIKKLDSKSNMVFKEKRKWDTKPRLLASIKKAIELIGYHPIIKFEDGIDLTIEWFRKTYNL